LQEQNNFKKSLLRKRQKSGNAAIHGKSKTIANQAFS
jgi:hypothetical protein